jgi:peptide/nickel transport system substrate-binding protein
MKEKSGGGLSRRDFLRYSGIAAATSALSGAIPKRVSAKESAEELVVAFSGDPGHMDPRVEAGGIGWSVFHHIFEPPVWRDNLCNPIPCLVEKWEHISPTVMRWYLRKNVKFHNGEDFTAEAIKVWHQELTAPTSRSPSKDRLSPIKDFKVHDPHTIDLITEKPHRPVLRATTQSFIFSPRALREFGDKFPTNPVGTGQMKFVEYRPGQHVLMEANPNYWDKKSNFKRLRIRFIPETGTRVSSLEAGEVMMINNVPPDQLPRLRANPNLKVLVSPTNRVIFITLRCDRKPFDNKRVRQAMNYAVDKEALTKGIMGGLAKIAIAPIPDTIFAFHPNLPPYKYDPDRAKRMLAEAGATGATFYFGTPNGRYLLDRQVGEAIAGYLSAVGLNVKFESPPWSTFVAEVTKYAKSKYDGYLFGWGVSTGDPDQLMWEHYHSKAVKRTMYSNPEVDRLLDEARVILDEEKVKAIYYKAQEIVWDECPWIFTYQQPDICAINKRLQWTFERSDERYLFHEASLTA